MNGSEINIIETRDLDFGYRKEKVLKAINLQVPRRSIFGFLGINGAGKSTLIRLLLGLLPTRPECVFLFGREFSKNRLESLGRTGALIDYPTFYPHLSARANLRLIATLLGLSAHRVDQTLEMVGLGLEKDKKVKHYSVGLKQRLGLAIALLNDPELLILDEPANGLDPQGIIELRKLLVTLQTEHGKTIFLSSHLLDELEKVVTHLAVIHNGLICFQGTKAQLTDLSGSLEKSFLTLTAPS